MSLFQSGKFHLHSGAVAHWKIDCDALTDDDLATLAEMAAPFVLNGFGSVEGVPKGGLRFARHFSHLRGHTDRVLIVDDVLTTGKSMEEQRSGRDAIGV